MPIPEQNPEEIKKEGIFWLPINDRSMHSHTYIEMIEENGKAKFYERELRQPAGPFQRGKIEGEISKEKALKLLENRRDVLQEEFDEEIGKINEAIEMAQNSK